MLALFGTVVQKTRMEIRCLAAVFTPGVLYHPDDEKNPSSYEESIRVLEFLIKYQESFSMPRSHGLSQVSSNVDINSVRETTATCATLSRGRKVETPSALDQQSSNVSVSKSSHSAGVDPCPPLIYSIMPGSYSGTFVSDMSGGNGGGVSNTEQPPTSLRRTKTTPSKRNKFGEHEPPQVIHLNRNPSQSRIYEVDDIG
ncbi:hypothetical protein DFQ28_008120 [Apophysomyces sp. BC1034]|nr:hypothetical protein DFQ29_008084 [Apophysomyces sp. BC1021]KAG0192730.1 hypothetical protein DFQ28_008120 [Apophysomyces sp. BC1034]